MTSAFLPVAKQRQTNFWFQLTQKYIVFRCETKINYRQQITIIIVNLITKTMDINITKIRLKQYFTSN